MIYLGSGCIQVFKQQIDLLDEYSLSSYLIMTFYIFFHAKTTIPRALQVCVCFEYISAHVGCSCAVLSLPTDLCSW